MKQEKLVCRLHYMSPLTPYLVTQWNHVEITKAKGSGEVGSSAVKRMKTQVNICVGGFSEANPFQSGTEIYVHNVTVCF